MVNVLIVMVLSFLLLLPWGKPFIRGLVRHGIGKNIRDDEPDEHQAKAGTPTMGGLYFLVGLSVACLIIALFGHNDIFVLLGATLLYGLLGAYDDWRGLQDAGGVGWQVRGKFISQWAAAFFVGLALYLVDDSPVLVLSFSGTTVDLGWWYVPIAAFLAALFSNAVNLADGMDGLAGGLAVLAVGAYGIISLVLGQQMVALFCGALVGVLLAFLWFNVNPARVFMGDTGSQALGAALAAIAMMTGCLAVLPVIGLVFLAEAVSVMLQVSYFKYTRIHRGEGKRIFRMAPLHYHYELAGMSEVQVTLRFWITGAVTAAAGILLMGVGL